MAKKVMHLIAGLGKGGAETMLYQVIKYKSTQDIQYFVVSLGEGDYFVKQIRNCNVNVFSLPFRKNPIYSLFKIFVFARHTDTLYCWMYHANLIGYCIGKLAGVKRIVWCIRHSSVDPDFNNRCTLKINKLCAIFSKNVAMITYNGKISREVHERIGYCKTNGIVLENGCDCEIYKPTEQAREDVRNELGLSHRHYIILSISKDHPIKDIPTFLKAFGLLRAKVTNVVALMCGNGITEDNAHITTLCKESGLLIGTDIFLLGVRHDVTRLLAACDLYVLHSAGEAFPNTLLQAMACGCLCVSTDVGDVRTILGNSRFIVPKGSYKKLFEKIYEVLSMKKDDIKIYRNINRMRVQQLYSIQKIVKQYENIM